MSSISCWISGVISVDRRRRLMEHAGPMSQNRTDHALRGVVEAAADLLGGGGVVALDLVDRIAAEFLEKGVGQHECDHRFTDDGRGRHCADVAAFDGRRRLVERAQVDGAERRHQRGDRLHEAGDPYVLTVGDAAFEAAGVVGRPDDGEALRAAAAESRRARASPDGWPLPDRCRCRRP